ncbi:sigma-70 family RNA polymerase sigma factor [Clostridium gasigenes]|uniref:RNA polymerase sigma-70 factor, ECF subfamily n=1 Tax=Clostridium gasigenes TaxID=94869 RepID=A0A1H0Q239_9CLOT|nr:sigma-70 family RNA polymerase sigma factor [Clostridium gasigenes]MBU3088121.1 sigma-70 family RNA polymerase sigma factor [Clostridium gasigenes]SDP11433.1 RNA polymerase sigma-70 factor, ECF subfamily [Clostridium gasigenes]
MLDELMVRKAIKGDEDSFMVLVNQCKEQIYRTAYAYVKDENLALDIVQETVCKAFISISKLKEPKYFNTWIIKIAINISISAYKKNQKVICMEQGELLNKVGVDEDNNEKLYLLQAIDTLPDKHKDIIILKYFDDLTIQEIARVLDMPLGTVKTYLNKGLIALRIYMKKEVV